jgi:putative oxidoreductase
MMRSLFKTDDVWSGLVLRLTLGLVMFLHGAQKLLGWYGGFGFDGTMRFFTQRLGLPWSIAYLVIIGECFPHGFFMNWSASNRVKGSSITYSSLG